MAETTDKTDIPSGTGLSDGRDGSIAAAAAGLLRLHAAPDQRALADAFAALARATQEDTEVCLFLDDGSGALLPLEGGEDSRTAVAGLRLSTLEEGPVAQVHLTGEAVVLDDLSELIGEPAPPLPDRRILLARLRWQEETLGVALFCGRGFADLSLYLQLADHAALALVRLRALNKSVRFGGIDPSRWLFDREWLQLRLEEEVQRALRYDRPLTLFLFLFEGLDEVARQVGVRQTEVFLRKVGAIVRGQIRSPDVLAGYGDTGVAVLLPETDSQSAVTTLNRIASRVGKIRLSGQATEAPPVLLLSMATCPTDASSAAELMAAAESRLAPFTDEADLQKSA